MAVADSTFDYKLFSASFLKKFGSDSLVDLKKTAAKGEPGTFLATPSESLNVALGIGGFPLGRVIEIYGPESSGKSTLALEVIKQAQQIFPKLTVGYLDVENAVNKEYAEMIGIDLSEKRFAFVQESETEKALDMAHVMAQSGIFSVVVVDSVAGLISKHELEEQETTHSKMGGNAKAMSSHLRFMQATCAQTNTLVIYLNQVREKVGIMFGNPETTPGGRALGFYASVRVRTKIIKQIVGKEGTDPVGVRVGAQVIKNKVAAPLKKAEYDLIYGKGIDQLGDLIDVSVEQGILPRSGSWYVWDGKNVANGRDSMKKWMTENPDNKKILTDTLWSLT